MGMAIRGASRRRLRRAWRRRTAAVASALLLSAGAGDARAQSEERAASDETTPTFELDPTTVEADRERDDSYFVERSASPKRTEPLRETPQSITVVPEEVIEDRGATSVRDILRGQPGITLAAGEGGGPQGDNLQIRGFAASSDLFLDGMRDLSEYTRDPFLIERVEIPKGPGSAYAGRGSTGGIVNFVTKKPTLENFVEGSVSAGTDSTLRVTADANRRLDGIPGGAIRLNAMGHTAEVAGRDVVEEDRWGVYPAFSFELGEATRVTLSYLHLEGDGIPDFGHPFFGGEPVDVRRGNFYGFAELVHEDTEVDMATAFVEHDLLENVLLHNQFRYGDTTRESIVNPPRNPDPADDTVVFAAPARDGGQQFFFNQTQATAEVETLGLRHTLVGGVEVGYKEFRNKNFNFRGGPFFESRLFDPDPYAPFPGTRIAEPASDRETDAHSLAFYAFDTIELGRWIEVSGGVRWDRFDAELENAVDGDVFDQTDDELTYRVGVVGKVLPTANLYAAYGTSFNPSAEQLALSETTENVDPEKSRTYEVGAKWDALDRRLALTAALFRIEKTDARTPSLEPDVPAAVLEGEQRVDGFELGAAGSVTDRWQVFAGYAFLDSEIEKSNDPIVEGNEIINAPEHALSVWTTYAFPWRIEGGFGIQHVSSKFADFANRNEVDDYVVLDAMVGYQAFENVAFRVNVFNLADDFYYDRTQPAHALPGPGRTALFTTTVRF